MVPLLAQSSPVLQTENAALTVLKLKKKGKKKKKDQKKEKKTNHEDY